MSRGDVKIITQFECGNGIDPKGRQCLLFW
jgi:hypothetical protein